VKFLIDAQLSPGLARLISENGHEAQHVATLGLMRATDAELVDYARRRGAVIVTKDEDFSSLYGGGYGRPAVLWIRIGNCSNAVLIGRIAPLLPAVIELLEKGERLVVVQ
jgi:predicted nuclease of predicted toxin-antitoxin system